MKWLLVLLFPVLSGCAVMHPSGIFPGKSLTYTLTMREPVVSGSVQVTIDKEVTWCHLRAGQCDTVYTHPKVAAYMFFTKERFILDSKDGGIGPYYHTHVGAKRSWNLLFGKSVVGTCAVTFTKEGNERMYEEVCTIGDAVVTAKTAVTHDELLWMEGVLTRGKVRKHFELSSARYSL